MITFKNYGIGISLDIKYLIGIGKYVNPSGDIFTQFKFSQLPKWWVNGEFESDWPDDSLCKEVQSLYFKIALKEAEELIYKARYNQSLEKML